MKNLIIAILAIGFIIFVGCEKERGCTDPNAINFDSAAEEDNGTCEYPQVVARPKCPSDTGNRPQFQLELPDLIPQEAYDIYTLTISGKTIVQQVTFNSELICNDFFCDYLDLIKNHEDFDTNLVNIYNEINQSSVYLGEKFYSETKEVFLISTDELSYIFDGQDLECDWQEFCKHYENSGFVSFSKIAFNRDKTQAIFKKIDSCGMLCGGETVVFLKKIHGVWIVKDEISTWLK